MGEKGQGSGGLPPGEGAAPGSLGGGIGSALAGAASHTVMGEARVGAAPSGSGVSGLGDISRLPPLGGSLPDTGGSSSLPLGPAGGEKGQPGSAPSGEGSPSGSGSGTPSYGAGSGEPSYPAGSSEEP